MQAIKEFVDIAQQKYMTEKIYRSRWSHLRASGINDDCLRRLFYYRTCGELATDITPDVAAIFQEGIDQEIVTRRYLSELGIEVKKAGFTEIWERYDISGSIDGVVEYGGQRYLAEVKSVSEYAWEKLNEPEDFNEGYYKKWLGQIQIYMLLTEIDKGVFLLKRKQAKQIKVIELGLDYAYAEGLLKKAETVNEAVKQNQPPDYLKNNPVECKRCQFFAKICNPPLDFGTIALIEDEELAKKLVRREELSEANSEYGRIDKEVKERLRDIRAAICGEYSISGKEGIIKRQAQEAGEIKTWRIKIERINNKD